MGPIETLKNEHGLTRQFVDGLSMAADKIVEDMGSILTHLR
jgi:hypothetical protein